MNKISIITLSLALGLTAGAAHAFSLGDAARLAGSVAAPDSGTAQSANLLGKLSDLNVTPEQAIGGTSALLDLARNQLPGNDYSQLLQAVPALSEFSGGGNSLLGQASAVSGLLGKSNPLATPADTAGNIQNLAGVAQQFNNLGMDASMISQFAPVLLDFIGNQGIGQPLLGTLTSLWSAQP